MFRQGVKRMGRIVAWLMIIMGCVILGFNGYKFWGEINIAVRDPKVAMAIAEDWQETEVEPSLTSVENLNTGDEDESDSSKEESSGLEENDEETKEVKELVAHHENSNQQTLPKQNQVADGTTSQTVTKRKTGSAHLQVGSQIGQLIIPKIGAYLPIVEGTDDASLEKGVGKYIGYGTVAPDETGHVVLSGHRHTVFKKLGQLVNGDKMYVKYKNKIYTYQIRKTWITHAEDRTVIVPIPRPVLTVTTCYPFDYKGNAPDRYIIRADLVRISHA